MTLHAAMIFAAGFGTRMRHLTAHQPKPMVALNGRPMIDHALDLARAAGATHLVSNLHYKPDGLAAHLARQGVKTILETPEILDTGGGLLNARDMLGTSPVWTVNPDAVWQGPNPLSLVAQSWDAEKMDACLVMVSPDRAHGTESKGDFRIADTGQLTRGQGAIYGGIQIVNTARLVDVGQRVFSLNALWNLLDAEGRLFGVEYPGSWCDVGTPEGLNMAEAVESGRA